MRSIRYLCFLLLTMLTGVKGSAQSDFTPASPDDPGVPPQQLIVVASPADGGTVSGAGRYTPGTTVTVRATAGSGWQFLYWSDDANTVLSTQPQFKHTKQGGSETIVAHFGYAPAQPDEPSPGTLLVYYPLTVSAAPGGTASGGGRYRAGTSVRLIARCDADHSFAGWVNEDGEVVSTDLAFNYTTQERPETLIATFDFIPADPTEPTGSELSHYVTLTATEGGTVEGGGRYLEGTEVTLRAQPNAGYIFTGWYHGATLYEPGNTFRHTVGPENLVLEARFVFDPYSPTDPVLPVDMLYSFYLMSPSAHSGRTVDCRMYLSNVLPLKDMRFDLSFPESLVPDMEHIQLADGLEGYTVSVTAGSELGTYTVMLIGGTVSAGNKEIFSVRIPIPADVAVGEEYMVKISQVSVTQRDGTTCTASTRNGRISVSLLGDVDRDRKVTMSDANAVVNRYLGGDFDGGEFDVEAADVDVDGSITMSDANAIVNMYLGN